MKYIYVLKCPESGDVRYVGKTDHPKARLRQHLSEARLGGMNHKCDWIRSLLNRGLRPVLCIDQQVGDDEDWKSREIERVAYYRRIGCDLVNGTNGGDEPGPLSEEGRRVLAERASRQFGTPEGRERQRQKMLALCRSPEWVAARAAAAATVRSTNEYRQKMSQISRKCWSDQEFRKLVSDARGPIYQSAEYRAKLSRATARTMSDPERRAAIADQMRRAWSDPVFRQRRIESLKRARA